MAKTRGRPKARKDSEGEEYKTRNWATIVYPESAPEGWRETLTGWHVQAFVSPLHDRDVDPGGEAKKAHWHVMVVLDGPRTRSLMEKEFKKIGGVGCEACVSVRGYARYLCHLDNPEKAQYDVADVEVYGGADYMEVIETDTDRERLVAEMIEWCEATDCISFRKLLLFAKTERPDWFRALNRSCTMLMFRFLRSREHDMQVARRGPAIPATSATSAMEPEAE